MAINLGAKKEEALKPRTSLSKTLVPGTQVCTINGMTCKKNDYNNLNGYDIVLQLEGPDLTSQGFEGFFIDMNDQDKGRHKGAVGNVKLQQYSFSTKTFPAKEGKPALVVDRDDSIIHELGVIAKLTNTVDKIFKDEDFPDVETMIAYAGTVLAGHKLNFTIAGREYTSGNYTKYDLFLPKASKGFYNMEVVGTEPSSIERFDPNIHIVKKKSTAAPVESFEPVSEAFDVDFSLQ